MRINNIPRSDKACKQIDKELNKCKWDKIEYKPTAGFSFSNDLTTIIIPSDLTNFYSKVKTDSGNDIGYVYFLKLNGVIKYVGKAADIKDRLEDHLIKSSTGTHSKIQELFNNLSTSTNTSIEYCYFRVVPFWVYPGIELLMMDHLKTLKTYGTGGWNQRRD